MNREIYAEWQKAIVELIDLNDEYTRNLNKRVTLIDKIHLMQRDLFPEYMEHLEGEE